MISNKSNDTQQKPFACTDKDCEMTFTNKDHLEWHQKKHEMMLNLGLINKNNDAADQTPTPTRFIRNCEEVGLFQDLQNVNPFDEIFKKATDLVKNGGTLEVPEASNSSDTLHTPHILPHIEENNIKAAKAKIDKNTHNFTLSTVHTENISESSPKIDSTGAESVKEKIIKTLQNKEKLKNERNSSATKFLSVVPFQNLTAKKSPNRDSESRSQDAENKEKIREMNRAAQIRCRKRKQLRWKEIEEEVMLLREENKRLKLENHLLKCQLSREIEKDVINDAAKTSTSSDKSSESSQVQKKVTSPTVTPIIIHIGPNITSPIIPLLSPTRQPSSKEKNTHAIVLDNSVTKSVVEKKKSFRKIVPKILIENLKERQ